MKRGEVMQQAADEDVPIESTQKIEGELSWTPVRQSLSGNGSFDFDDGRTG